MRLIDSLQLQRLIDGQLDPSQTRQVLIDADANPERWREIAVAFVENQFWQSEIRAAYDPANPAGGSQKSHGPSSDLVPEPDPAGSHRSTIQSDSAVRPPRRGVDGMPNSKWWLALAATVVLSIGGGFFAGRWHMSNVNVADLDPGNDYRSPFDLDAQLANDDLVDDTVSPPTTLVSYEPDYHLRLQDADGNQWLDGEIPLFHATQAQKMGYRMEPPTVSEDLKRRWAQAGYRLQLRVRFVSGKLDDGRQFVVPVRTVNLLAGQ